MYRFHHRVHLADPQLPLGDEPELVLYEEPDGRRVSLRAVEADAPLGEATEIRLRGVGFPTAEDARASGDKWRTVLERAFAAVGIAADFGDRAMTGFFTREGLEAVTESSGAVALNDRHSLLVFEDTGTIPMLAYSGSVKAYVSPSRERFLRAISAPAAAEPLTQGQRLAFDLYSSSFRSELADTRFLLLMMAVETMIDQGKQSPAVRDLVDDFLTSTRMSSLSHDERTSLEGSLKRLADESVNQAGRRLAATLGDREYAGRTAVRFFSRCYNLRSALVHGEVPRPPQEEIGQLAAPLQLFVGDLIAGTELVQTVADANA